MQQLPLIPTTQHYRVGTTLDGESFVLDIRWNGRDEAWYMDVLTEDETPIRHGIKIVMGGVLGGRVTDPRRPAGLLLAVDPTGSLVDATLDDLGTRVGVYFVPSAEL